jgi:hypothetical protein
MARRVKTTTAKAGQTANDRRVLAQVNTVTNAPTLSTDGYLLEQNEFVHLLFKVSGTSPVFRIRIWWYSQVSGEWHKGRQIVINANDIVYLQVETAPTGTNPLLSAWIALVRPV